MRKTTFKFLKGLFILTAGILLSFSSFNATAQYVVDFEGPLPATNGYGSKTVTLNGIDWDLTEALIGNSADDWKNGANSARFRNKAGSSMTMLADKANGLGMLSFQYRIWGTDAAQVPYIVEYSTTQGASWTAVGSAFTPTAEVQTFSETVNATGNVRIRIAIVETATYPGKRFNIDDITLTDYSEGGSVVSQPVFSPNGGTYYAPVSVSMSCATEEAIIYYTTDGTEPDGSSAVYSTPVSISASTTLKAIALKAGMTNSSVTTATYTFPEINEVSNIAALRQGTTGTTLYKLTGEAFLTFQHPYRNTKYIQDATAAIVIDDMGGKIQTTYNLYDGITGIMGTLTLYNGLLQFIPVSDPGAATSTINTVVPEVRTLASLTSDDQAKLIKVIGLSFGTPDKANFAANTSYNIFDASGTSVFRTPNAAAALDYFGQPIPSMPNDVTLVVGVYNSTIQVHARNLADFIPTPLYNVNFQVTDGTNPLPGVAITIPGQDNLLTNESGAATTQVIDGSYTFTASLNGYQTITDQAFTVNGAEITIPVVMQFIELPILSIASLPGIESLVGATFAELGLPTTITATLSDNSQVSLGVNWSDASYNPLQLGEQTITGTPVLVPGVINPDNITASIVVTLQNPKYSVTFNITDSQNQALEGAYVHFNGVTYGQGVYTINNLVAGTYPYSVSKTGYVSQSGEVVVTNSNQTVDVIMPLETYQITFNVKDGQNQPLSGATVTIENNAPQTTGADGQVVFESMIPGSYTYTVSKAGYNDQTGQVILSNANQTVNVVMPMVTFQISIIVKDSQNQAISGAIVSLNNLAPQTTGANGTVVFEELVPGTYNYQVQATAYNTEDGTLNLSQANITENVNLIGNMAMLTAYSFTIGGQTYSADIEYSEDYEAYIFTTTVPEGTDLTTLVGNFTASPGAVVVNDMNEVVQQSGITINDFSVYPVFLIVTSEDEEDSSANIIIVKEEGTTYLSNFTEFSFEQSVGESIIDVENQTITVEVEPGTSLSGLIPVFEVSEGAFVTNEEFEIFESNTNPMDFSSPVVLMVFRHDLNEITPWIITVTVQQPVYNVNFVVSNEDGNAVENAVVTFNGTALQAGSYTVADVAPGTYNFSVSAPDYLDFSGQLTVTNQDVTQNVVLQYNSLGALSANQIKIYPNPSNGKVSIELGSQVANLVVINQSGQVVAQIENAQGFNTLDLSNLAKGVYFVRFESNNNTIVKKLNIIK